MQMKLVSLNVGLPREVTWHGMRVTTGIFKQPVAGRVMLRRLNLDGDRQADLTVHGGEHKAVYCYPLHHYDFWKNQLPGRDLPMGMFGENFTLDFLAQDGRGTDGGAPLLPDVGRSGSLETSVEPANEVPFEDSIHIGDKFSVGSAEVVVTQPRLPCYKLGIRFQMDDMVKRFLASGRTGFYLAVLREGEVGTGDELKLISRNPPIPENTTLPVSEITRLYTAKRYSDDDARAVRLALQIPALPESWKGYFQERLQAMKPAGFTSE